LGERRGGKSPASPPLNSSYVCVSTSSKSKHVISQYVLRFTSIVDGIALQVVGGKGGGDFEGVVRDEIVKYVRERVEEVDGILNHNAEVGSYQNWIGTPNLDYPMFEVEYARALVEDMVGGEPHGEGYKRISPLLPLLGETIDVPTLLFFYHLNSSINSDGEINEIDIVDYLPPSMLCDNKYVRDRIRKGLGLDKNKLTPTLLASYTMVHGTLRSVISSFLPPPTSVYTLSVLGPSPQPNLVKLPSTTFVKTISCGGEHAALGTVDGKLWTWGRGGFGRLGHGGGNKDCWTPKMVVFEEGDVEVNVVACGYAYTCVGGDWGVRKGGMWSFGANENGRLGTGDESDKFVPTIVQFEGEGKEEEVVVKDIKAGSTHTCVLGEGGKIYTCGHRDYSGHGVGSSDCGDVLRPKLLKIEEPVTGISVGPGGYHTLVVTDKGNVYSWGHNRVGQLGCDPSECELRLHEGENEATFKPTPDKVEGVGFGVEGVEAGWGHSALFGREGVKVCGRNVKGQLGLGDPWDGNKFPKNERKHPYLPTFTTVPLPPCKAVSCGGEHTLCLTKDNVLYAFGKGEKGQCGKNKLGELDAEYHTPRVVKEIADMGREVLAISAANNLSMVLVGGARVKSLTEICRGVITENGEVKFEELGLPEDYRELFEDQWEGTKHGCEGSTVKLTGRNVRGVLGGRWRDGTICGKDPADGKRYLVEYEKDVFEDPPPDVVEVKGKMRTTVGNRLIRFLLTCYDDNEIQADLLSKILTWYSEERLKPNYGDFGDNIKLCTDFCRQFNYDPELPVYNISHLEALINHVGWHELTAVPMEGDEDDEEEMDITLDSGPWSD